MKESYNQYAKSTEDNPSVSDDVYRGSLEALEAEHPEYAQAEVPRVESDSMVWKYQHEYPLMFAGCFTRIVPLIREGLFPTDYTVWTKIDGLLYFCQPMDGVFSRWCTWHGSVGENITENVKRISDTLSGLDQPPRYCSELRAEFFCASNIQRQENGEAEFTIHVQQPEPPVGY